MSKLAVVRWIRPLLLTAALLAAAVIAARSPAAAVQASTAVQPKAQSQVTGEGPNRAALVVDYGNGRVDKVCLAFTETDIGGHELLSRAIPSAGLSIDGAVCTIGATGCPIEDCFCQCGDLANCSYWAYYLWENDKWAYSNWGIMAMADTTIVAHGDMQAWVWGSGDIENPPPPPDVTYEQVCPAIGSSATATPTRETGPQVTFTANPQTVAPGECTVLSWQTVDATTVTIDGVSVEATGSKQECLQASRGWSLTATNGAGQATQVKVAVQVTSGTPSPTPQLTGAPTTQPAGSPVLAAPTSIPRAIVTQAPGGGFTPAATEAPADFGVPLAPTAESLQPLAVATPLTTPTRYVFSAPPTETPRPRRVLAAGGPTPTPLLVARAESGSGAAPAPNTSGSGAAGVSGSSQLTQSRAFTPELLPQYAAYAVTVAVLLAMGVLVLRRRSGPRPELVVERADETRAGGSRATPKE